MKSVTHWNITKRTTPYLSPVFLQWNIIDSFLCFSMISSSISISLERKNFRKPQNAYNGRRSPLLPYFSIQREEIKFITLLYKANYDVDFTGVRSTRWSLSKVRTNVVQRRKIKLKYTWKTRFTFECFARCFTFFSFTANVALCSSEKNILFNLIVWDYFLRKKKKTVCTFELISSEKGWKVHQLKLISCIGTNWFVDIEHNYQQLFRT
jgi:hypothetical protein